MPATSQLLSPKQVAKAIGVSESSLKRWCDQGLVPIERTPGGHRKIHRSDVFQFLRRGENELVRPELLGLPAGTGQGFGGRDRTEAELVESLGNNDFDSARRLVFNYYLSGVTIAELCDSLLGPVMHRVGDKWKCGTFEVYQEHRACEILGRVVHELQNVVTIPRGLVAMGGTPVGDYYRLATSMIELTLSEAGWQATSLGTSLPFETLTRAVEQHRPQLFWLSMSHLSESDAFEEQFADWLATVPATTHVVFGGRVAQAEWADLRDNVSHCDNFVALRNFASELTQPN